MASTNTSLPVGHTPFSSFSRSYFPNIVDGSFFPECQPRHDLLTVSACVQISALSAAPFFHPVVFMAVSSMMVGGETLDGAATVVKS